VTASDAELLERAVALARANVEAGEEPFGSLVVRDGEVLGEGVNTTRRDADPTAHAEVAAVREACRRLGTVDLGGATVFTSCEPCPMCRTVAVLAGVTRIVYAVPAEVAARYGFALSGPGAEMMAAWPLPGLLEHVPTSGAEEPFERFTAPASGSRPRPVQELRTAVTVEDYDGVLAFYRDALGLPVIEAWEDGDARGVILDAGQATLELLSVAQAELIDRVEVGERVAGPVRLALEVADSAATAQRLVEAGAEQLADPVLTPWNDLNVRLRAPGGMQLTLFTPSHSAE
jgi:tRNA(Arg) A34 adenosine deaminase TadA/catechol 2,3-dioxygenase-like lactoylglutathione lyase family enzyme